MDAQAGKAKAAFEAAQQIRQQREETARGQGQGSEMVKSQAPTPTLDMKGPTGQSVNRTQHGKDLAAEARVAEEENRRAVERYKQAQKSRQQGQNGIQYGNDKGRGD